MKWTPERVRYIQRVAYETDAISLNTLVTNNGESMEDVELGTIVADPTDMTEIVESKIKRQEMLKLLQELKDPRQTHVLSLRFGLYDGECKTLEEIGEMFGVTRERIRQIEVKGLRKMRELLTKKGLTYNDFQ